ncbi:unnamed protein product, partial [Brenthis ino]
MNFTYFISIVVITLKNVDICNSYGLNLHSSSDVKIFSSESVYVPAMAGVIRSKTVIVRTEMEIKAIKLKDINNSLAVPKVIAGGLGFQYVHINLYSDRGRSLSYVVEVYI